MVEGKEEASTWQPTRTTGHGTDGATVGEDGGVKAPEEEKEAGKWGDTAAAQEEAPGEARAGAQVGTAETPPAGAGAGKGSHKERTRRGRGVHPQRRRRRSQQKSRL